MGHSFVDLSHTVEHGMVTYEGLPAPLICDFLTREASRKIYAAGTEFHIGRIEMVANTGTYVDSPFHRYATGADLSELSLESLADLEATVIQVADRARPIDAPDLKAYEIKDRAVLVHTNWSKHWRQDQYLRGHPFLTADAADYLASGGAKLVGIDSYNIDDTADMRRPVHSTLLGAGIPIVEHMTGLGGVPEAGFRFFAVPVKVRAFGTFPVRAFALLRH
jgi:kynurenine formamidase